VIDKQREQDDEILRALTVLEDADATESEADAAFQVLVRRLPKQSARTGFAARVMYAVHQAPLPAGRLALKAKPSVPLLVGAATLTGIAALWAAVLLASLIAPFFARVFASAVQVSLLFIAALTAGLDVWAIISTAAGAVTQAATSAEMLSVLAAITSVGVLSFGALTRLLSSRAAEPQ